VARGIVNYSSADLQLIRGLRSDQVEEAIGEKTHDEVIHRDNLVVDA
jgi:glutamate 5-kinase